MCCLYRHNVEVTVAKQNKPVRPGIFSSVRRLNVVIHFFGNRLLDFECATVTSGNGARKMLLKPFKTLRKLISSSHYNNNKLIPLRAFLAFPHHETGNEYYPILDSCS